MSSKKLDSILKKVPPATSRSDDIISNPVQNFNREKMERIVAVVPASLKRQIKQYIVDHPGETEKTVLIKGLLSMGFNVDEAHMKDNRGKK